MDRIDVVQGRDVIEAALREIANVKETATRVANGDTPEAADHTRVLAGLVRQLAEQTQRLFTLHAPIGHATTFPEEHGG
jgi:hypothetical protein